MPNLPTLKVIVVEDESLILQNIVHKLNNLPFPIIVCATATNGEDALSLIHTYTPDVVFTDIRMPVMDGLALLKILHQTYPSMRTIIISGYDDFEYARTALQLGCYDYLLKPVRLPNLSQLVEKIYASHLQHCQQLEESFFKTQLLSPIPGLAIPPSLQGASFQLCLIGFQMCYQHCPTLIDTHEAEQLWQSTREALHLANQKDTTSRTWLVSGAFLNQKILIYESTNMQALDTICQDLLVTLQSLRNITLCYTTTSIPPTQLGVGLHYLRQAFSYQIIPCTSSLVAVDLNTPPTASLAPLNKQQLEGISILLSNEKYKELPPIIQHFFYQQCLAQRISQQQLEYSFFELIHYLEEKIPSLKPPYVSIKKAFYELLASATSPIALYDALYNLFDTAVLANLQVEDTSTATYQKIKHYIDTHFATALTLDALADRFHFSPSYITRIFKKYYGQPPIKYILFLRMEEAKKLIRSTDLDLKVIAEMVGYPDAHYFSRIFKLYTGTSPSSFKKS